MGSNYEVTYNDRGERGGEVGTVATLGRAGTIIKRENGNIATRQFEGFQGKTNWTRVFAKAFSSSRFLLGLSVEHFASQRYDIPSA